MSLWPNFMSGLWRARSRNVNAEMLVNAYTETVDDTADAKHKSLNGSPGLKLDATVTPVGGRGCFSQDGRTFAVVGDTLFERTDAATWVSRGTIVNDFGFCTFATNGRGGEQVAICGGGYLYIFTLTTNTLSAPIALPLTNPPGVVRFSDGYFLLTELNTIRVWFSSLEDGTAWSSLDFYAPSQTAGNVIGIEVFSDHIWTFQSQTYSVYYNSGDLTNPFVPYPSTVIQEGLQNRFAVGVSGEAVVWLAQSAQGSARVMRTATPSDQRISNPGIEFLLSKATTLDDAELFCYEQGGHPFVVLTCPSLTFLDYPRTFVYDVREQTWHFRGSWNTGTGQYDRWRVHGICNANGTLIVDDLNTGNLGILDLDTYDEYGAILRRARRAPYISAENQWVFLDELELQMETGVGLTTGQGSAPVVNLQISADSAHSWQPQQPASIGVDGDYNAMVKWFRQGRYRTDRLVIEISQSDPVKMAWTGLNIRATPGTGYL